MNCNCRHNTPYPEHSHKKHEIEEREHAHLSELDQLMNQLLDSFSNEHNNAELQHIQEFISNHSFEHHMHCKKCKRFSHERDIHSHHKMCKCMMTLLQSIIEEVNEKRMKCHCCDPCKCKKDTKASEKSNKQNARKLSVWVDNDSCNNKRPNSKPCKCKHQCKCTFSTAEEMESEFCPTHHKKRGDMPKNIWLSDLLSLLRKKGMLNLDVLFSTLEAEGNMNFFEESFDEEDLFDYFDDDFDWKNHYTKEFYYGKLPLKKVRKKRHSFS